VLIDGRVVLVLVGFLVPIALTVLSRLPCLSPIVTRLNPYLIWPSTIGSFHNRSLPWGLGNPPKVGQAILIIGFIVLNIVLSCVGYQTQQPHPWGYDKRNEILAYAGYRTGEFAFALLPLTILLSGRNNVLLWLTDWSHSTFMLLHRWVARLCALHTILHSIFLLAARIQVGTYSVDKDLPYWQWGIVGTVFISIMLIWSMLWMRRLSYEIFLIGHIIMAIFVLVGSWYHLVLHFGLSGSYEYWLYAAFAVWGFDRLMRVLRVAGNGIRRSIVTDVGPNHVRIEIPGIRFSGKPGFHGYVHFPTLNKWTPWENHPFSINSTALLKSYKHRPQSLDHSLDSSSGSEKRVSSVSESRAAGAPSTTAGLTLYVRKSTGMTRLLQKHESLLTLLDGPYVNNPAADVLSCDRLLLIGGGIGITGLLGFVHAHTNVKLAWSIKASDEAIARDLDGFLQNVVDREIRIGQRLDLEALLRHEARAGYAKVGVVACGPGALCDNVRATA
jgi:predicted ferric reductase